MHQGTIARLTDRGFGFISIEGMEKDIFFLHSHVANKHFNDLREGEAVMCEFKDTEKGLTATTVEVIEGGQAPSEDASHDGGEQAPAEGEMPAEEAMEEGEVAPMAE